MGGCVPKGWWWGLCFIVAIMLMSSSDISQPAVPSPAHPDTYASCSAPPALNREMLACSSTRGDMHAAVWQHLLHTHIHTQVCVISAGVQQLVAATTAPQFAGAASPAPPLAVMLLCTHKPLLLLLCLAFCCVCLTIALPTHQHLCYTCRCWTTMFLVASSTGAWPCMMCWHPSRGQR